MGRPSKTGETIVVAIDGDLLMWTEGLLSGTNRELVKAARWMSDYNIPQDLSPFGPTIDADLNLVNEPEKALAAMLGAKPGRGRIVKAPVEVLKLIPMEAELDEEDEDE